ncbi:MAG: type II toxin-antitoxin system VapC family toxin [Rubrivivax sp.]
MSAKASTAEAVLIDTGLLVALYAADDPHHARAQHWIGSFDGALHTVGSVLAETAWQLPARDRWLVANLAQRGIVRVHGPDASGYARIGWLLKKYADLDPDWADVELVWLAEATGIGRIATLDVADFGVYRMHGRRAFDIVWPR